MVLQQRVYVLLLGVLACTNVDGDKQLDAENKRNIRMARLQLCGPRVSPLHQGTIDFLRKEQSFFGVLSFLPRSSKITTGFSRTRVQVIMEVQSHSGDPDYDWDWDWIHNAPAWWKI
jgi:hypothetical protein